MDREALIFLHIPKTAGTTLNRIIEWQYNPVSIFTVDPHRIRATAARFKRFSEQRRRRFRVVRGHLLYGIHEFLPQGATYITMLRDPVARLLSTYSFILRRPLHPLHRKLKAGRLGVEDLIRMTPHRQNLQCRFISGIGTGGNCDERVLEVAKENLTRAFRVVGLCEQFQESLCLMMAAFGWKVPFYDSWKVAKTRPSIEPDVIDVIREHNRLDVELYDFAKKLFEENLRSNSSAISEGLATFNSRRELGAFKKSLYSTLGAGRFLVTKAVSAL
ncbi:MAG TPA: sulfotransferase family 2 domain-containing protein [Acidobacteriota bacterium]